MTVYDLEALSLNELKQLQKDVGKAICGFDGRKKAEARATLEGLAKELGYSLSRFVGSDNETKRAPAAPKYRHPENLELTWSGRGSNRYGLWRR